MFRKKAEDALLSMGITPNLKGFHYILDVSEIILEYNFETKIKVAYAVLKNRKGIEDSRVERDIRTAISKANRNSFFWKNMGFGEKATNTAFLSAFTLLVKRSL